MKTKGKPIALLLIFFLGFAVFSAPVTAAPPSPTYDEAVFVNLDYYGGISTLSIVKGVSLNGNTRFTDYGDYSEINNMSGYQKPVRVDGGIRWKMPQNTERLFYEVKMKPQKVELPWTFDIGYKLNGQPVRAERLAGARGLVEISIHVKPNLNAQAYYLNNLLLQVAMPVNMENTLSVEAPGAQLQSIGTYKMVLFVALPGQEDTYTVRIGSESFESPGIVITMLPGTSSQLQIISDLRQTRKEFGASFKALYTSYNDLLNVVNSMQSGVSQLKTGMEDLDRAADPRDTDQFIEQLGELSGNMRTLSQNAKTMVPYIDAYNKNVGELTTLAEANAALLPKLRADLQKYKQSVNALRITLSRVQNVFKDAERLKAERKALSRALSVNLSAMNADLLKLRSDAALFPLAGLTALVNRINQFLDQVKPINHLNPDDFVLDPRLTPADAEQADQTMHHLVDGINLCIDQYNAHLVQAIAQAKAVNASLLRLLELPEDVDRLLLHTAELAATLEKFIKVLDGDGSQPGLLDTVDRGLSEVSGMLNDLEFLCNTLNDSIDLLIGQIDQLQKLNQVLLDAGKTTQGTLGLCSSTLQTIAKTCENVANLSDLARRRIEQSREPAQQIMLGMVEVLDKSMKGIVVTHSLKNSGNAMHDLVRNQIAKIDAESNILSLDPNAKLLSFTSDRNVSPESIQVILRTQEIGVAKSMKPPELEAEKPDRGILGRIADIFIKIKNALVSIFE
ncbi:MAG: hypothetical protein ACM3QZ_06760 [Solirubrobacterales bacterium]